MGEPGDLITPLKTTLSSGTLKECPDTISMKNDDPTCACVCVCACMMYLNDCRASVRWNEWFGIGVDDMTPSQNRLCLARLAWMPPTRSSAIGRRSLTPRSKDQQEFLGITCRQYKLHLLICFTLPHTDRRVLCSAGLCRLKANTSAKESCTHHKQNTNHKHTYSADLLSCDQLTYHHVTYHQTNQSQRLQNIWGYYVCQKLCSNMHAHT